MTELRIPAIGDAVGDVQLVEWTQQDGTIVSVGDTIFTVESDKSVVEISSPSAGQLKILEKAGGVFAVGYLIGTIV